MYIVQLGAARTTIMGRGVGVIEQQRLLLPVPI